MNANLSDLKKAHSLLMSKYIDVLNQTANLPFFVAAQFKQVSAEDATPSKVPESTASSDNQPEKRGYLSLFTDLFSLKYLVQLFVEAHIRGKMLELSVAYSYLAQKHLEDPEYLTWLRETSEDCTKLAQTLTSWQSIRGIVSIWWPVLISLLTARLGLGSIYEIIDKIHIDTEILIILGLIMVFPLIYLSIFISYAFASKRGLFMPGFDRNEKPIDPHEPADIRDTIYYLEDQVFHLAHRKKVREIPLDIIGLATGSFVFAFIPVLVSMAEPATPPNIPVWLSGAFFAVLGILGIRSGMRRKLR